MNAARFLAALLAATPALAAAPTADEIKKVEDYYENGKADGPVLLEFTPCLKVDKKPGEEHKSCLEPAGASVKAGKTVNAWMRWFVPKGGKYEDLSVQFKFGGEARATKDFSVTESRSYGIYLGSTLAKAGDWEIVVRKGETVVASAKIKAE